jgi:peptidoglycan/LPS O-acetylase OafA/YrhL
MYQNTPLRAVPYLVGMALGYVLSQKFEVPMKKAAVLTGWFLSAALCLSVIFVILIPYSLEYKYDRLDAAFYAGFHKLGWSVGIAWVVWACVNGHGGTRYFFCTTVYMFNCIANKTGPVNRILSWKYFLPLSKLSFSAYLVHQDWMQLHRGLRRTSNYLSHFEAVSFYFERINGETHALIFNFSGTCLADIH